MVASRLANYVVFPCSEERGQAVQLFCEVGLGGRKKIVFEQEKRTESLRMCMG